MIPFPSKSILMIKFQAEHCIVTFVDQWRLSVSLGHDMWWQWLMTTLAYFLKKKSDDELENLSKAINFFESHSGTR